MLVYFITIYNSEASVGTKRENGPIRNSIWKISLYVYFSSNHHGALFRARISK